MIMLHSTVPWSSHFKLVPIVTQKKFTLFSDRDVYEWKQRWLDRLGQWRSKNVGWYLLLDQHSLLLSPLSFQKKCFTYNFHNQNVFGITNKMQPEDPMAYAEENNHKKIHLHPPKKKSVLEEKSWRKKRKNTKEILLDSLWLVTCWRATVRIVRIFSLT